MRSFISILVLAAPAFSAMIIPRAVKDDFLQIHNDYRARHSAAALTWNDTLAAYAQDWADKCVFEHKYPTPYGENLNFFAYNFANTPGDFDIAAAVKLWYKEIEDYDFNNPDENSQRRTGRFTQVVWKGSKELGCAVASCKRLAEGLDTAHFYVCEYYPKGNYPGQFAENVSRF